MFWDAVTVVPPTSNEAAVELKFVLPLLYALGFSIDEVAAKVPVKLKEGTKRGRPFEADFVAYSSAQHDQDTSLLVIEAKAPGGSLEDAQKQGESYAMALRAPALLLTDGICLQIWQLQPTLESKLIFECSLLDIKVQRGNLEKLIAKPALVAHATNLVHKKITTTTDFRAYESAEIVRTQENSKAIERQLLSESGDIISSEVLLDRYTGGAIISAPSGYGKTTLAVGLLRQGIERRCKGNGIALPVDVPLVDLALSNSSFIDFVQTRIVAHLPQMTAAGIHDIARSHGLLLVCDGYDRLEPATRLILEVQMRQIVRDFPKSKLFVFSRGSVMPKLSLPHVQLKSLSLIERKMMATKIIGTEFSLSAMPRLLIELSEIPLILERIIAFWLGNQRFPVRLEELFEHWVQQFLGDLSMSPTSIVLRRKVLFAFARELGVRRLTPTDALELTVASCGSYEIFDALIQCGALLMSTTSVEFVHEGLADHLRAHALAALPQYELLPALSTINFDEDSLLPVLLVAQIKDPLSHAYIWERLREMSLPRYIDAIRFSEDTGETFTAACLPLAEQKFTEDMANSIEALVDSFFPLISAELRGCLAHQLDAVNALCLIAKITPEPNASLNYTLQPNITNTVQVAYPSQSMYSTYLNLAAAQIGIRDGRYMGAIVVRDALNYLVEQRRFSGGIALANERTIGRLRFMHEEYGFPIDPQESLSDLVQRLQPIKRKVVTPTPFHGRSPRFTITHIINDLELLLTQGHEQLDWWWLQYGAPEELASDQKKIEGFLRDHYKRTTALYLEIVNASFGKVSNEFSLFQVAPVRWELAIVPSSHSLLPIQYWRWLPVASEAEAGLDISFYDTPPQDFVYGNAHDSRLIEELGRLGRNTNRYSIGGRRSIPDSGTKNWRGQLTGETSAMQNALSYLEDDVKYLFGDLPARSLTLGDIPLH